MNRPRRVARSRVVSAVTFVLLVTVAMIGYRLSDPSRQSYELLTTQLDRPVAFAAGRVVVSDVRIASELKRREVVTTTPGAFVVVRVGVQATGREKVTVADTELHVGGRTYAPVETLGVAITADPGFESSDDVAFEVDPGDLSGMTLQVWNSGFITRYEQRVQTSLGVTPANAERWARAGRQGRVSVGSQAETRALP